MPRRLVSLVVFDGQLYAACDDGSVFRSSGTPIRASADLPCERWSEMAPVPGTEAHLETEVVDG